MPIIPPDHLKTIPDDDYKSKNAMNQLLPELQVGIDTAVKEGWISEEDFRKHFYNRTNTTI